MITLCKTALFVGIAAALATSGLAYGAAISGSAQAQSSSQEQPVNDKAVTDSAATKTKNGSKDSRKIAKLQVRQLQAVQVTGISRSAMKSIQLKRTAPDIQDSISQVNIGQLPDITIADSLSRITGVQVDHVAGEGTTINIRGLPEVSTLMNGQPFITADNIYSIQPNMETLPSELFSGVDVLKSATANRISSGISGTVNLHTHHPWDLPFGWTASGTVEGGRGSVTRDTKPSGNVLVGFNDQGRWGLLVGASYSDFVHNYGDQGWRDLGNIVGENSTSTTSSVGYLKDWSGYPLPAQIVQLGNNAVDVNGDGKSNAAFYAPPRFLAANDTIQPKRTGLNASFQADLGGGFTMTADGFYSKEDTTELRASMISLGVNSTAPTALPAVATATNAILTNPKNVAGVQTGNWNQTFYTVQDYNVSVGDFEPESIATVTNSISRNYNVKLSFDNGSPFTGTLQLNNATASQEQNLATMDLSSGNGVEWPNQSKGALPAGTFNYPNGPVVFNPNGTVPYTYVMNANFSGKNPVVRFPSAAAAQLSQENSYVVKGPYGGGSFAHTGMNNIRADGHYQFADNFSLDFGLSNSIRSASLDSYVFASRMYAGEGATDPAGCLVRYNTVNRVLYGEKVAGACTAGNANGFFDANPLPGPLAGLPSIISSNMEKLVNPGEVSGMVGWALNPASISKPFQWFSSLVGGTATKAPYPAASWNVLLKNRTAYTQANFSGDLAGLPFSGNFGVRMVKTDLDVTQFTNGVAQTYGLQPLLGSAIHTKTQYTDILPAINVAINLTPDLVLRLAEAKNMMPLSLDQWGGGFKTTYQGQVQPDGSVIEAITGASSTGNPNLKPWRSQNYDASLEYYMSPTTMFSLAWFRINMASFIEQSSVLNCSLPDEDGVVRGHCIGVNEPVQGSGAVLRGFEGDYRQAFTSLPGLLSHTGVELNATYSGSSTGETDMAGNAIPFPDNSKENGNLILWYQDNKLQVRLAEGYRSKKAVESNYDGISSFEMYQAPTARLDASVTYTVNKHLQVFLQAQNLTNVRQKFYLAWPSEKIYNQLSERYFFLGAHMNL